MPTVMRGMRTKEIVFVSMASALALAAYLIFGLNSKTSKNNLPEFASTEDQQKDSISLLPLGIHPGDMRQNRGAPKEDRPLIPDPFMERLEDIYDEVLARYDINLKTFDNASEATRAFEIEVLALDGRVCKIALSKWNCIVKVNGNTEKACELGSVYLHTIAVLGGKESLLAIITIFESPAVTSERKGNLFWVLEHCGGHLDDPDFAQYLLRVASNGCNADCIIYSGAYAILGRHGSHAIADPLAELYLSASGERKEALGSALNLLLIRHGLLNVEKDLWWSYRDRLPDRHRNLHAWLNENRAILKRILSKYSSAGGAGSPSNQW